MGTAGEGITIRKNYLITILFLLISTASLFANGQSDKPVYTISDAEKLVQEKNYDEAIRILVEIVRSDPEQMEQAQRLIVDIRNIRDTYNQKYEELITVLFENEDYERSLELIAELETLDNNPNDTTSDALDEARVSAELVYFRVVFNDIMDRGALLLAEEKYQEAVSLYRTGFNLYRRTFDDTEYGNIIKDPVYNGLNIANESLDKYSDTWNQLNLATRNAIQKIQNTSPDALEASIETELQTFDNFLGFQYDIVETANVFTRQNDRIVQLGEFSNEDFFLSFLSRILSGRESTQQREGIRAALELHWEQELDKVLAEAEVLARSEFKQAEDYYNNRQWDLAQQTFSDSEKYAQVAFSLSGLARNTVYFDDNFQPDSFSNYSLALFGPRFDEARYLIKASKTFRGLSNINSVLAAMEQTDRQDYLRVSQLVSELDSGMTELTALNRQWNSIRNDINQFSLGDEERLSDWTQSILASSRETMDQYNLLKSDFVVVLAQIDFEPLELDYQNINRETEQVELLIRGSEDPEEKTFKYPQRGLSLISELNPQIDDLSKRFGEYIEQYQQQANDEINEVIKLLNTSDEYIQELTSLRQVMDTQKNIAQDNIYAAQSRIVLANDAIQAANRALRNNQYEQALEETQRSFNQYIEALEFDEDAVDRQEIEERNASLSGNIYNQWNQYVVVQVRNLINEGKNLYYKGSYPQSEATLKRAEELWTKTNPEENPDLTRWLEVVQNALSANYGRTVAEADPLFGEVSQLLNLAYKYYSDGRDLIKKGNRTDGLKSLSRSEEYVFQIIAVLPINQAASILSLKIEQERDPEVFLSRFREMYNGAVEKIGSGRPALQLEAYNDLKDLSALNPDYPGIKNRIYNLEITLGLRPRPADPRKIRESEQLTRQALAIVRQGDRAQFRLAKSYLTQALKLNPDNEQASELFYTIQTTTGGTTTVALSTEDQRSFKEAEEKYINGEYYVARSIVNRLLENANNRRYPPLLELKRRIDSKI